MTAWCDWLAVVFFFTAMILAIVNPPRVTWGPFAMAGLFAWSVPIALTATHIMHS